jgi:hypothetical protein
MHIDVSLVSTLDVPNDYKWNNTYSLQSMECEEHKANIHDKLITLKAKAPEKKSKA